jgi:hypothetical protein
MKYKDFPVTLVSLQASFRVSNKGTILATIDFGFFTTSFVLNMKQTNLMVNQTNFANKIVMISQK